MTTTTRITQPAATIEILRNSAGVWYLARCADGHTSGWCVSEAQARSFLHTLSCDACRGGAR